MAERKSAVIYLRLTEEERKRIKGYCAAHYIRSEAEFIRKAMAEKLEAEAGEIELAVNSNALVIDKVQRVEEKLEMLFEYLRQKVMHDMAFEPEVSAEMVRAAAARQVEMAKKFDKTYIERIRGQSPSMFESLLADFFEEK